MQKISSYIYKNRIQVVSDTGYFPTEWRIVYQRVIKIYKGINNVIEFDIKNGQQRRMDISALVMKMAIMDELNEEVCTIDVTPVPNSIGLAHCAISANVIAQIVPQFLKYSLYIVNLDGTKSPIYGDTQYGMIGKIHLLNGAIPEQLPPLVIDTFNMLQEIATDSTIISHYFSEGTEIRPPNDYVSKQFINLDFIFTNLEADISVQVTDYAVISNATIWHTLENFSILPTTTMIHKQYNHIIDYSNNVGWLRITYTPTNKSTGKIEKVTITL